MDSEGMPAVQLQYCVRACVGEGEDFGEGRRTQAGKGKLSKREEEIWCFYKKIQLLRNGKVEARPEQKLTVICSKVQRQQKLRWEKVGPRSQSKRAIG